MSTSNEDTAFAAKNELLRWSETLSAIARTGLGFTTSIFEMERFEEILRVAADIAVSADSSRKNSANDIVHEWMHEVRPGVAGYVTPRVAVGAIVGNDRHEILLIQRADSGAWLFPTGWADVGYSAAEVVKKEVEEETGFIVEVDHLAMILDGFRLGMSKIPLYSLVFSCAAKGGTLKVHPLECKDAGWFGKENLPAPLAGGDRWVNHAFAHIEEQTREVLFDRPRERAWRVSPARGATSAGA